MEIKKNIILFILTYQNFLLSSFFQGSIKNFGTQQTAYKTSLQINHNTTLNSVLKKNYKNTLLNQYSYFYNYKNNSKFYNCENNSKQINLTDTKIDTDPKNTFIQLVKNNIPYNEKNAKQNKSNVSLCQKEIDIKIDSKLNNYLKLLKENNDSLQKTIIESNNEKELLNKNNKNTIKELETQKKNLEEEKLALTEKIDSLEKKNAARNESKILHQNEFKNQETKLNEIQQLYEDTKKKLNKKNDQIEEMQKSINDGNTTFIEIIKKYKIRFNPIIEAIETIIKIQNNINNQNQDSNIKLKDQKLDEVPKKEEYKEELAYFKELNEALKAQKYKSNRLLKYDTILILELLAKKAAGENTNWQKKIKKGFSWAKNTIVELFEEKNKEEKNKEEKNNLDNLNKQEKKLNKQTKEIIDQINKAHVLDFKGGIYANPNNCLLSNLVSTSWQTIKFSFNNNSLSTKIAMIGTPTVTLAAIGYFSGIGGMGSATLKTVELFFDFLKKFASDNSGKIIGSIGTLSTAGIVKLCTNNPCYNCPKNVNRNVIYCKECRKELFEKLLKHYQICTNKENCFECNDYNYILNTH